MTIVSSTAPGFIQALYDALTGRPGLAGVGVHIAPPKDFKTGLILVADVVPEERTAATNRRTSRDVRIEIPGEVHTRATDFAAAWVEAGRILDELEDEVLLHPIRIGLKTKIAAVEAIEWLPGVLDGGGWLCRGAYKLTVEGRLHG